MEDKIYLKDLSEKIRLMRRETGLNQTEFGKKIGLSIISVSRIENGQSDIFFTTLVKIAEALESSIVNILEYKVYSPLKCVEKKKKQGNCRPCKQSFYLR